ncbi:Calcium-binding EF-hand family protein [Euphorbia peplus]|nr:Calcium-binding EF-hand family protein [Euphorbia peplus]
MHFLTTITTILLLLLIKTHGRSSHNHVEARAMMMNHLQINSSILGLNPLNCIEHDTCIHYYGFLPCATNVPGYMFQIVVLEFLLLVGDKILTKGRQQLFSLFGVGIYGATVFRILQVLPNIALVLASGLAKDREAAIVTIENGVGSLAGSTVFYLTLQWGICVLLGMSSTAQQSVPRHESTAPIPKRLLLKQTLSRLKGYGVETDKYTKYTAGIMLLSLVPLIVVELASRFKSQPWGHIFTLTLLSAALVIFFVFQSRHKWIQERSLEYSRDQLLLAGFLGHLQTFAKRRLVNNQGNPDVSCIRRVFVKLDKDGNEEVSVSELREFLQTIKPEHLGCGQDVAIDELMKHFDQDSNRKITIDEFQDGCQRFIEYAKMIVVEKHDSSRKYMPWLHKIVKPENEKQAEKLIDIAKKLSEILKTQQLACLLTDGKPDQDKIRSLFKESDTNKDGNITLHELKEMITTKFQSASPDPDAIVDEMMRTLDTNKDNELQEDEFTEGITRGLSYDHDDSQLISLCIEKQKKSIKKMSMRALTKALLRVIIGIAIVSSLLLPLIQNTQRLSESIGIPAFYVSFVLLPFAVNFKTAVANIFPASQKKENAASIMFSEIYGAVFMNNILGLLTIIGLIWARDFAWEYSAEVLVMWVVGVIIGLIAYTNTTYTLWTCILAFSFYPLSLLLYYIIHYIVGWK